MKKVGIAILVLVVLAGGAYAMRDKLTFLPGSMKGGEGATTETAMQEPTGQPFSGTLKAAVALGVPMKCTYTLEDNVEAVGYIKGKNYYGESNIQGKMGKVIVKNDCMWTWTEDNKGFTMCYDLPSPSPGETAEPGSIWDKNDLETPDVEMRCEPAVVDDAMFEAPAEVEFTDMSKMMESVKDAMEKVDTSSLKDLMPKEYSE